MNHPLIPLSKGKKPRNARLHIPAGKPEALNWEETRWEYDDHAVLHAVEGYSLTLEEIGAVMGISRERVRQLEKRFEHKLNMLANLGLNVEDTLEESKYALREIIKRHDHERLVSRLKFAERVLADEELQERILNVYGPEIFSGEEIDFSKFIPLAKALDKEKNVEQSRSHLKAVV